MFMHCNIKLKTNFKTIADEMNEIFNQSKLTQIFETCFYRPTESNWVLIGLNRRQICNIHLSISERQLPNLSTASFKNNLQQFV